MTEISIALIVCLAVILVLAALLYAGCRSYLSALTGIGDLHADLTPIMAKVQIIDESIRPAAQGSVRRPQAPRQCDKRDSKTLLLSPIKSMAGSPRSGRD
jgi:hypothetical protein